jgi:hypothetical protein
LVKLLSDPSEKVQDAAALALSEFHPKSLDDWEEVLSSDSEKLRVLFGKYAERAREHGGSYAREEGFWSGSTKVAAGHLKSKHVEIRRFAASIRRLAASVVLKASPRISLVEQAQAEIALGVKDLARLRRVGCCLTSPRTVHVAGKAPWSSSR